MPISISAGQIEVQEKMYLQAGDPPQSLHLVPILHSGQLLVRPANNFSAFTQLPLIPDHSQRWKNSLSVYSGNRLDEQTREWAILAKRVKKG